LLHAVTVSQRGRGAEVLQTIPRFRASKKAQSMELTGHTRLVVLITFLGT
jgi:hypothetical protein